VEVLSVEPLSAWALNNLGNLHFDVKHNPKEAREMYKKALEIDPDFPDALVNYGPSAQLKADLHFFSNFPAALAVCCVQISPHQHVPFVQCSRCSLSTLCSNCSSPFPLLSRQVRTRTLIFWGHGINAKHMQLSQASFCNTRILANGETSRRQQSFLDGHIASTQST
jgi:tetratricopeptide (TPR) repeat protein